MSMKKIVFLLVILGLAGAGFFYWWNNQADVRELNKTLAEGIRVEKNLLSNEYTVVNKVDGYAFKVPPEWNGIEEIEYIPEREELGFRGTSINIEGKEGDARGMGIDKFQAGADSGLAEWTENMFRVVGLVGDFARDNIDNFEIIKTQENIHLGGMYLYFFKDDSTIYSITSGSEEFIKYIIANGQW